MWIPGVSMLLKGQALSWLFEVLPVMLLTLQTAVAIVTGGDVDGRSSKVRVGPDGRGGKLGHFPSTEELLQTTSCGEVKAYSAYQGLPAPDARDHIPTSAKR